MNNKPMLFWLIASATLVFFMIAIGGLTRLTQSGLSMVEWQLFNILPPITQENWAIEFAKYQTSPEFKLINSDMDIEGFKQIFWLEYIHRLLGRFVGLFIIIPAIFFYIKKHIHNKIWPVSLAILVIFQGILGWYMVKTGLKHDPHVTHYSLAMHLSCASLLYSLIIWQILNYSPKMQNFAANLYVIKNPSIVFFSMTFIQIIIGAFVAGLKAGLIYNQFPLMGQSFIPIELDYFSIELFNDPVAIQFFHRIMAYLILMISIYISYELYHLKYYILAALTIIAPIIQAILGILTLLYSVPISIALLHQCGSILLLTLSLFLSYVSSNNSLTKS